MKAERFNEAEIPNYLKQIFAKPKEAKRAQQCLSDGLHQSPSLDPLFTTIEELQQYVLGTKKDIPGAQNAQTINKAISLMGELIFASSGTISKLDTKTATLDPRTLTSFDHINTRHQQLLARSNLARRMPNNYWDMVEKTVPALTREALLGTTAIEVPILPILENPIKQQQLQSWFNQFGPVISRITTCPQQAADYYGRKQERDHLVDLLMADPRDPDQTYYYRRHSGTISIAEIVNMPFPLDEQAVDQITDYALATFADQPTRLETFIWAELLGSFTVFKTFEKAFTYRNKPLLKRLNSWQEHMLARIVFPQDSAAAENKTRQFLRQTPQVFLEYLLANMPMYAAYGEETDAQFMEHVKIAPEKYHPLSSPLFISANTAPIDRKKPFITRYLDEIGVPYFTDEILPHLKQRLEVFGAAEKLTPIVQELEEAVTEHPFSKTHLETVKKLFQENCGEEFLTKLDQRKEQVIEVTKSAWEATYQDNVHFMLMLEGFDTINFTPGSVPDIMGLESVSLNATTHEQDWAVNLTFKLKNSDFKLLGLLDQEGNVTFKAPIEQEIPGLYAMLKLIATLAFHDLVVQTDYEQQEKSQPSRKRSAQKGHGRQPTKPGEKREWKLSTHPTPLPRQAKVQSDKELVQDVYHLTNFQPRVVHLHPRWIPGAAEYLEALKEFKQTSGSTASLARLQAAREELHKPSKSKIEKWPQRFHLPTETDPGDKETYYLKTWVVEHTSPTPTKEELASLPQLFEKYYKPSSFLSFMDQFFPSFVGQ